MRVGVLAALCVWLAQQPGEPQRFRADTRLVEVHVVAYERGGQAVQNLAAEDFRLFENGREQPFELFGRTDGTVSDRWNSDMQATERLAPGAFADLPAREIEGTLTALLIDRLNTRWEDQGQARREIMRFLEQMRPGERIAIYALDGPAVTVLHDFTEDHAALARVVNQSPRLTSVERDAIDALPEAPADAGDREMATFLEKSNRLFADWAESQAGHATITALESIGHHLGRVHGRKNLVWISGGFPLRGLADRGMTVEIQRATRSLNNGQVTLYSVDARGLLGAFTYNRGKPQMVTLSMVYTNLDILTITADETGGRAFYNTNDLARSIRRSLDDARETYVLGYYPSHGQWDGRYRQIRVRVNRPGVEVRHRRGYFATPSP